MPETGVAAAAITAAITAAAEIWPLAAAAAAIAVRITVIIVGTVKQLVKYQ